MLRRSKSLWTIVLTLASMALIASAGAQAQGKSAGKGKGAEQATVAHTAPGHVKSKGNGHPNHKGNGYGHGPHEGSDDGDDDGDGDNTALLLPTGLPAVEQGCFWVAAAESGLNSFAGDIRSEGYFGYYVNTAPGFAFDSTAPLTLLTPDGNDAGTFELVDIGSAVAVTIAPVNSTISFSKVRVFAGSFGSYGIGSEFTFAHDGGVPSTTFNFNSTDSADTENGLVEFVIYAEACGANPDGDGTSPS